MPAVWCMRSAELHADAVMLRPPLHCPAAALRLPFACSSLRELAIAQACLDASSIAAMAPLRHLTSLALSDCDLESLPHGPYLTGLER